MHRERYNINMKYDQLKLDNQICFRLYTASRLLTQAYHPLLSVYGLTYPQYLVLLVLWEEDAQPVNTIAKRLYLETNTVTPLLQRMEKQGIITREKGKKDARQMIVKLTKKGLDLRDKLVDVPSTMNNAVVCDSVTPETTPELFKMLDEIIAKFKNTMKKMTTIYDFKALSNRGEEVDMAQYKGQVLMIVNTASKCGFTPQYDGLEALYQKYKDQGFVIIGFPCDQFAHQEPGSDEEIAEFCRINHGVTFQLMKKIDVNGEDAHPIFEYLKSQAPTEEYKGLKARATRTMLKSLSKSAKKEGDILWNFTKFLISKDGSVIKRFAPTTEPKDMEKDINELLNSRTI